MSMCIIYHFQLIYSFVVQNHGWTGNILILFKMKATKRSNSRTRRDCFCCDLWEQELAMYLCNDMNV